MRPILEFRWGIRPVLEFRCGIDFSRSLLGKFGYSWLVNNILSETKAFGSRGSVFVEILLKVIDSRWSFERGSPVALEWRGVFSDG